MSHSYTCHANFFKEQSPRSCGLYIHIPFCRSRCGYCSFYSTTACGMIPHFVRALRSEIALCRGEYGRFDTVYFGGGTPSTLAIEDISAILSSIHHVFSVTSDAEITIEANPGDLTPEYIRALKSLGFNRLSIGVQSLDDRVLSFLERRHTLRDAVAAIENAQASFSNIAIDLLYGIPGQSVSAWLETLKSAVSYAPCHLSCYQLSIEPATSMGRLYKNGAFTRAGEALEYELMTSTSELLSSSGYVHYEVSNYSLGDSWRSRHNQKYWNHTPYLGLGPSAHSYVRGIRWWNYRSLERYIRTLNGGDRPVEDMEILSIDALTTETFFLGLRTGDGINLEAYPWLSQLRSSRNFSSFLFNLASNGFIKIDDTHIKPTEKGLAVADRLALMCLQHLH